MSRISSVAIMLALNSKGFKTELAGVERDLERTRRSIAQSAKKEWGTESVGRMVSEIGLQQKWGKYKDEGVREAQQAMMRDLGQRVNPAEMGVFETTTNDIRKATVNTDQWSISLRGVARTAGLAAAAIEATSAVTLMLNGRFDEAANLVKTLPYGIGHIATALEGIIGQVTGWTAEIERNKAAAKSLETVYKAVAAANDLARESRQSTADYQADLIGRARVTARGAGGWMDALQEERRKELAAIERWRSEQAKALGRQQAVLRDELVNAQQWGNTGVDALINKQIDRIQQEIDQLDVLADRRRRAYGVQFSAQVQAGVERQQKQAEEDAARRTDAINQETERQISRQWQMRESLIRQQSQLEADAARARGDNRAAEEIEIRENFRRQEEAALSVDEARIIKARERIALEQEAVRASQREARQVRVGYDVSAGGAGPGVGGGVQNVRVEGMNRQLEVLGRIENILQRGVPARIGP